MYPLITNIQRYAIHDGDGIRTTVFFKGCPLSCSWCHNPETQSFKAEGKVFSYSPGELAGIIMRDRIFFEDAGGVTLSGGEPLAQDTTYILALLKILKQNDINTACDTCGDVPWENFASVLPYVDVFLFDIKAVSRELHIQHTGRDNLRIIDNLKKLVSLTAVWLRIPFIGGFNDGEEMQEIINLAKTIAPNCKVFLLPYHSLGEGKWAKINKHSKKTDFYTPSSEQINTAIKNWKSAGFEIEVGG